MPFVISTTEQSVTTLQMNRVDKLNALNREMYAELTEGFRNANADGTSRVIVLKGSEGIHARLGTAGRGLC